MSTASQDTGIRHISEITVSPRSFDLEFGDERICWEGHDDVDVALQKARSATNVALPHGKGGYVLVGLNADGEDYHEVVTQESHGLLADDLHRSHAEVIGAAIEALILTRDGILQAQGGAR